MQRRIAFARQGFGGASLQEIGVAAGVSRSTPAYFFGNKNDLYEAVLARVVERAQGTVAECPLQISIPPSHLRNTDRKIRGRLPRFPGQQIRHTYA